MRVYFAGKGDGFRRSSGYPRGSRESYPVKGSARFRPCHKDLAALSREERDAAMNAPERL
jgi:hypothetical protein